MSITEKNDNFCSAPWLTIHVEPSGSASPCCISGSPNPDNAVYGNLHKETFSEIMHGEKLKEFRRAFMNNEKPEVCNACWSSEALHGKQASLRNNFNKNRFKEKYYIDTESDGTYDDMKITYWDFRPSNRCNLACLTCCTDLSSGVWQLQKDLGYNNRQEKKFLELSDERWNEIFDLMKNTLKTEHSETHYYFAGGEPLQIPQHHAILDHLVENEYFDVSLRYNTNLTSLKYKGTNWADVWSKFDKVVIDASIDAAGPNGEFQRQGSNWKMIRENIKMLVDRGITVTFNTVITMITYPAMMETIRDLEEIFPKEHLQKHLRFVGTNHPDNLHLNNTPKEFLDLDMLDKIDELGYNTQSVRGILSAYDTHQSNTQMLNRNWRNVKELDRRLRTIKGVGFNDVLPWFDDYVKDKDFND